MVSSLSRYARRQAGRVLRGARRRVQAWREAHRTEEPKVTHTVTRFRSDEVQAEHIALVADAFAAEGVTHVVVDVEPGRPSLVAVPATERAAAHRALVRHLTDRGIYLTTAAPGRSSRRTLLGPGVIPDADQLWLFRYLCSPEGHRLPSDRLACQLQFWTLSTAEAPIVEAAETLSPGTMLAPVANRWSNRIDLVGSDVVPREVHGTVRPCIAPDTPHVLDAAMPIDAVFTWVDGTDPAWIDRKEAALRAAGDTRAHPLSADPTRFVSRDELRYSLRALEMFAGWFRHVYLVTDHQVPPWLDTSHPGLTVVDHTEIFADPSVLPTFNSHAIESQLHHIEGLSENFIYLNDDVFFARPVGPSQFFLANGMALFQPSQVTPPLGPVSGADTPVTAAAKNTRDIVLERFGRYCTQKMRHVPHPLRRSTMFEIEERYAAQYRATAASRFRAGTDLAVASSLAHYYGFMAGHAVPGKYPYFYVDIGLPAAADRLAEALDRRTVDVFCLNEQGIGTTSPAEREELVTTFLQAYFPLPSAYERA